jgi:hypothetical protein
MQPGSVQGSLNVALDWQKTTEFEGDPISQSVVDAFNNATESKHSFGIPLTFCTVFRKCEFQWLYDLNVDFRNLLHTDQEYEYLRPLKVGDRPLIRTRLIDKKVRRSMNFYTLQTEVHCDGEIAILARSSFVIREPGERA